MKTIQFKNIAGGTGPYKVGILGLKDAASVTEFSGIPNGTFRGYIEDASGKRSMPKTDVVRDPNYDTDRKINWANIPQFSLPASVEVCVWGWGAPRWLDEATPSDALLRGFTHSDNGEITSPTVLPATKRANFNTFNRVQFNEAVNEVLGVQPGAINAIIVQVYDVQNNDLVSNRTVNYTDYAGNPQSAVIPPDSGGQIYVKYGTYTPVAGLDTLSGEQIYNQAGCSDADLIEIGKALFWKWTIQQNFDTDAYDVRAHLLLYDEEVFNNTERFNAKLIQGIRENSITQGFPCKIVWYGKPMNGWGIGVLSGTSGASWKQSYFPYLSSAYMAQLNRVSGYPAALDASLEEIYIDPVFYFKNPLPEKSTKYHKQNGAYVLDVDGERVYRKDSFTEVIRNKTVTFHHKPDHPGIQYTFTAEPTYGYTDNIVPEMFYAITQFYMMASKMITLLIGLRYREQTDENIYGDLTTQKVKACPVLRNETEPWTPGGYTTLQRPYTDYQVEWWVFSSLILCNNYYLWTGYYNQPRTDGVNKNAGIYKIPGRNPDGTAVFDFSEFEAFPLANSVISDIDSKHDVFGATSQLCVFYNPADQSHEILGWGRLKGNRLLVHLSEPRLDYDETMTVYIKNRINSYVQTVKLKGNQNFIDVFYLPEGGTYLPKDIYIEYADIYGQNHKCTGDLREHNLNRYGSEDSGEPVDDNFVANESLGYFGKIYGSDDITFDGYKNMRDDIANGVAKFNFYGNEGASYPAPQDRYTCCGGSGATAVTENYVAVDFPSHSVSYSSDTGKVHMKLFDASDNLIWELYDTKGGFSAVRGNNHPDNCRRWVSRGNYKIWIKNMSDDAVMKYLFQVTGGATLREINLAAGDVYEENISLQVPDPTTNGRGYKFNCNIDYS